MDAQFKPFNDTPKNTARSGANRQWRNGNDRGKLTMTAAGDAALYSHSTAGQGKTLGASTTAGDGSYHRKRGGGNKARKEILQRSNNKVNHVKEIVREEISEKIKPGVDKNAGLTINLYVQPDGATQQGGPGVSTQVSTGTGSVSSLQNPTVNVYRHGNRPPLEEDRSRTASPELGDESQLSLLHQPQGFTESMAGNFPYGTESLSDGGNIYTMPGSQYQPHAGYPRDTEYHTSPRLNFEKRMDDAIHHDILHNKRGQEWGAPRGEGRPSHHGYPRRGRTTPDDLKGLSAKHMLRSRSRSRSPPRDPKYPVYSDYVSRESLHSYPADTHSSMSNTSSVTQYLIRGKDRGHARNSGTRHRQPVNDITDRGTSPLVFKHGDTSTRHRPTHTADRGSSPFGGDSRHRETARRSEPGTTPRAAVTERATSPGIPTHKEPSSVNAKNRTQRVKESGSQTDFDPGRDSGYESPKPLECGTQTSEDDIPKASKDACVGTNPGDTDDTSRTVGTSTEEDAPPPTQTFGTQTPRNNPAVTFDLGDKPSSHLPPINDAMLYKSHSMYKEINEILKQEAAGYYGNSDGNHDDKDAEEEAGDEDEVYVLYMQTEDGAILGPLKVEINDVQIGLPQPEPAGDGMRHQEGLRNRQTGTNTVNEHSSRSHSMLTLQIDSEERDSEDENLYITKHGKLTFVDLAGSEKTKTDNTSTMSAEHLAESNNINKSLLVLGNCISSLGDPKRRGGHIPYRDSKLTKLLADSLGGGGVTLMIACVSPSQFNSAETMNTLRYANRAKKIKSKPVVKMDPRERLIMSLKKETKVLRQENHYLRQQLEFPVKPRGQLQKENDAKFLQMMKEQGKNGKLQITDHGLYEMLQEYMIENETLRTENSDLHQLRDQGRREQQLLARENERLYRKLEVTDKDRMLMHTPLSIYSIASSQPPSRRSSNLENFESGSALYPDQRGVSNPAATQRGGGWDQGRALQPVDQHGRMVEPRQSLPSDRDGYPSNSLPPKKVPPSHLQHPMKPPHRLSEPVNKNNPAYLDSPRRDPGAGYTSRYQQQQEYQQQLQQQQQQQQQQARPPAAAAVPAHSPGRGPGNLTHRADAPPVPAPRRRVGASDHSPNSSYSEAPSTAASVTESVQEMNDRLRQELLDLEGQIKHQSRYTNQQQAGAKNNYAHTPR